MSDGWFEGVSDAHHLLMLAFNFSFELNAVEKGTGNSADKNQGQADVQEHPADDRAPCGCGYLVSFLVHAGTSL